MTEPIIEFWSRNDADEVIPQELTFAVDNTLFNETINHYELLTEKAVDDQSKEVYQKTVEALRKEKDKLKKEYTIVFTPLLDWEITMLGKKNTLGQSIDEKGKVILDLDAWVCAKHCIKPLHSFGEWLHTKDSLLKRHIALQIYINSFPKETDEEKELKKKVQKILLSVREKDT